MRWRGILFTILCLLLPSAAWGLVRIYGGHNTIVGPDDGLIGAGADIRTWNVIFDKNLIYPFRPASTTTVFGNNNTSTDAKVEIFASSTTGLHVEDQITTSSTVSADANIRWFGELLPDGSTCATNDILKKTGANDWDCAADVTGAGAVGDPGAWSQLWANTLAPTNTAAGIYVYASSTFDGTLRIDGNATATGAFAFTSGSFNSCTALETNGSGTLLCGSDGGGASGESGAWQALWANTLSPTNTVAGIFVNASSTIASNFRVDGDATTTGHVAALGGNSDQWNTAYASIWNTASEKSFWNGTTSWTAFDANWLRNILATSTLPQFSSQFTTYLLGTTTLPQFSSQFNSYLLATSTLPQSSSEFTKYLLATSTLPQFFSQFNSYLLATNTLPQFSSQFVSYLLATSTLPQSFAEFNKYLNGSTTVAYGGCSAGQILEKSATGWACGADDTGAGAVGTSGAWETIWANAITPTSSTAGIYVLASSTIGGDTGNTTIGVPAYTTRILNNLSASGTTLFVSATGTNLAITGLSAAACDVKAVQTTGVLYCGTDATSAGGGDGGYEFNTVGDNQKFVSTTPALFGNGLVASTTVILFDWLRVFNTATITNTLVVGATNPVNNGTGDAFIGGDATTTGHLAASGGNSDQWNTAFTSIWDTADEQSFWNGTTSWTAYDSNWLRNMLATSTLPQFSSQFISYLLGTTTLPQSSAEFNKYYNATTTQAGFQTQFNVAHMATTTWPAFTSNWNTLYWGTTTLPGFAALFDTRYNATTTQAGFQTQFNSAMNGTTTAAFSQGEFTKYLLATATLPQFSSQFVSYLIGTSTLPQSFAEFNKYLNATTTLDLTTAEIGTLTVSTAANLPANAIDALTEIAAALKSGSDATLITGTEGSNGHCAQWNVDGDLVTTGAACGGGSGSPVPWQATSTNTVGAALLKTSLTPTGTVSLYLPEDLFVKDNATTTQLTVSSLFYLDSFGFDSLTDDATLDNVAGDLRVVDVTCTDCLNATEIEDLYLLLAGDSAAGAFTWTGLNTWTDARPAMLNATNTGVDNLTVFTGLNMDSGSITNYFGTACVGGGAVTDVADNGTFTCDTNVLITTEIDTSAELAAIMTDEDNTGLCGVGMFCIGGHEHSWDSLLQKPATSTILNLLDTQNRIGTLNATTTNVTNLTVWGTTILSGTATSSATTTIGGMKCYRDPNAQSATTTCEAVGT